MGAHTPGPWAYRDAAVYAGETVIAEIVGIEGGPLDSDDDDVGPTTIANGSLIAAALDMLEALEGLVASVRGVGPKDGKVLARADAAIAKARGEV